LSGPYVLDNRTVPLITAYLFHAGGHDDPFKLMTNHGRSYIGTIALGMGFTFDDAGTSDEVSSLAEMHRLIEVDPRNAARIRPYIGGEEVNDSPEQKSRRYIINFGEMSEAEAKEWPDLYGIVFRKVKPYRDGLKRDAYRNRWWQFGEKQTALYASIQGFERVLVLSRVGQQAAFAFLDANLVFADSLVVFCFFSSGAFCVLQSRVHEIWARFFSSSMKDDLRYAPSDCFESFPFPMDFETAESFRGAGNEYNETRQSVMLRSNEGLTATYNRFHDPEENSPDIVRLRELHDCMDQVVINAYGWSDILPKCEFIPEFEDEDEEDESGRQRKRKYRYRWPDDVRDEVLARLLELNRQRALEEGQVAMDEKAAALEAKTKKVSNGKRDAKKAKKDSTLGLFAMDQEEA